VLAYYDETTQEFSPLMQFSLYQSRPSQYAVHALLAAREWRVRFFFLPTHLLLFPPPLSSVLSRIHQSPFSTTISQCHRCPL
jgi:hypothetical protein